MKDEIDDSGCLTTGESVEEYINRKAKEDPRLFEIKSLEIPNPLEKTHVEEPANLERRRHRPTQEG